MSGCTVCAGTGENLTGAICHGCHGTGRAPSTASVEADQPRRLRPLAPEGITAQAMVADAMEGELRRQIADLQATIKHERQQHAEASEKHAAEYHRIATALGCHVHDDLAAKAAAASARRNEMDAARSMAVHKLDRVRYVVEQFGLSCFPPDAHEAVSNALHALRARAEAAERDSEKWHAEWRATFDKIAAAEADRVHAQRVLATRNGELAKLRKECLEPHTRRCRLCNGTPVVLTSMPPQERHHMETCPLYQAPPAPPTTEGHA